MTKNRRRWTFQILFEGHDEGGKGEVDNGSGGRPTTPFEGVYVVSHSMFHQCQDGNV